MLSFHFSGLLSYNVLISTAFSLLYTFFFCAFEHLSMSCICFFTFLALLPFLPVTTARFMYIYLYNYIPWGGRGNILYYFRTIDKRVSIWDLSVLFSTKKNKKKSQKCNTQGLFIVMLFIVMCNVNTEKAVHLSSSTCYSGLTK